MNMVLDLFEPFGATEEEPKANQPDGQQEKDDQGVAHGVPGLRNAPDEGGATNDTAKPKPCLAWISACSGR
jgi:hypothetical protein